MRAGARGSCERHRAQNRRRPSRGRGQQAGVVGKGAANDSTAERQWLSRLRDVGRTQRAKLAPQLAPEAGRLLAYHQHHPLGVHQYPRCHLEHPLSHAEQAPAFARGLLKQYARGVHEVVRQRVEQQAHLVVGEGID